MPTAGLGADLAKLEAVCGEDPDALVMLRKALVAPIGRPKGKSDNSTNYGDGRGTTRAYTLTRLQRHRLAAVRATPDGCRKAGAGGGMLRRPL
jgi:hypothetical protein